jgi:hypothetical protein
VARPLRSGDTALRHTSAAKCPRATAAASMRGIRPGSFGGMRVMTRVSVGLLVGGLLDVGLAGGDFELDTDEGASRDEHRKSDPEQNAPGARFYKSCDNSAPVEVATHCVRCVVWVEQCLGPADGSDHHAKTPQHDEEPADYGSARADGEKRQMASLLDKHEGCCGQLQWDTPMHPIQKSSFPLAGRKSLAHRRVQEYLPLKGPCMDATYFKRE